MGSDLNHYKGDINQGSLGDCYFLAGVSAIAMHGTRLSEAFITDDANSAGVFAANVFVKGVPTRMAVDDYIAFYNAYGESSSWTLLWTHFAHEGDDMSTWGMLVEKMWAKLNGNYEQIVAGNTCEATTFLTGSTCQQYRTADTTGINLNGDKAYAIIEEALNSKWIVTTSCCHDARNDVTEVKANLLVDWHAYSIFDATTVTTANGDVKLVGIRNPWGTTTYNGTWSKIDDASWTDDVKSQVADYDYNDGFFYMEVNDFLYYFDWIIVANMDE